MEDIIGTTLIKTCEIDLSNGALPRVVDVDMIRNIEENSFIRYHNH